MGCFIDFREQMQTHSQKAEYLFVMAHIHNNQLFFNIDFLLDL